MKTSYAAKRQGDFFAEAEAQASPTPHTYVEHPRSRRPDPACAVFVQALAALQFSTVRARIVPSNDYDDLPESLIDTSPPPLTGSSASESLKVKRQRMAIDPGAARRFMSNSVLEILIETLIYSQLRRACAV